MRSGNSYKTILVLLVLIAVISLAFWSQGSRPEFIQNEKAPRSSYNASGSSVILESTEKRLESCVEIAQKLLPADIFMSEQWFRVLRFQISHMNASISSEISRDLGLILGDASLFWYGLPQDQLPCDYWHRYVRPSLPADIIWKLLSGWPNDDHAFTRWSLVLREWALRPRHGADENLLAVSQDFFGIWFSLLNLHAVLQEIVATVGEVRLLPLLCLLDDKGRNGMVFAATLRNSGWSWSELDPYVKVPPGMEPVAVQWWLESCQPERVLDIVDPASNTMFARVLEDAILEISLRSPALLDSVRKKTWLRNATVSFKKCCEQAMRDVEAVATDALMQKFLAISLYGLPIIGFCDELSQAEFYSSIRSMLASKEVLR